KEMSISKFAVNYHKKDEGGHYLDYDYDYDYGNKTRKKKKPKTQVQISPPLPIELILEILSRLPVKSLTRLSCASKYLYNYINRNPHFNRLHMVNYSKKKPSLVFYVNYWKQKFFFKNLFHARDVQDDDNDNYDVDLSHTFMHRDRGEYLGYCNGLICFRQIVAEIGFAIDVWNFTTRELLRIIPPVIGGYTLMSSGFGFDSINNEYKFVMIVSTGETKKCFVYIFGNKSHWREVRSPDSGLLLTSPSATFASYGATGGGGGALCWWTNDPLAILLFNLHEDKLQYIRIPVERNADVRMFEYKGYLAVPVLHKKSPPAVQGNNTTTTLTLEKVCLKILKAYKDDQVWVEETIDLSAFSIPFKNNFCFASFSDQILLYWAEPKSFQFFNLHRKCIKVVKNVNAASSNSMIKKRLPQAARAKDYWLNSEVENIRSLKTLLPVRAQKSDRAALDSLMVESFKKMWTLQQPKTVGGFFYSYYHSKTREHYFFDD
ncbi:hypothetical protein MKW94_026330, partial [Papaver nudicaule]|nr:hypothetical protein [Papaver nudicaule]